MSKMEAKKCSSGCKQLFVDGEYWGHVLEDKADEIAESFNGWQKLPQMIDDIVNKAMIPINKTTAIVGDDNLIKGLKELRKFVETPKPLKVGELEPDSKVKFEGTDKVYIRPQVADLIRTPSGEQILVDCETYMVGLFGVDTLCRKVE